MLIAQMTDIHIGFAPHERPEERNRVRFRAALAHLRDRPDRPDALVLSGDLTEHGDTASFADVAALAADLACPVWPLVGNHDTREALAAAFPQVRAADGFLHYALDIGGLRVLMLDTVEPGRHGGAFCAARAAWLSAQLDAASAAPTVIFMHHPPVASGIAWMDPAPGEAWVERFAAVVQGRPQIVAIHCGHLHRPLATTFRGIPLGVAPSIAPAVALDVRPIEPDRPDDRALIADEPPAYALHRWDGATLATHHQPVGDWRMLARYTPEHRPMIAAMLAERA